MAFASDSESDDEPAKKRVTTEASISQKRQARVIQEDALKEDPTIFQYDEVYDDINATREEAKKAKTTQVRESKYISRLLVTAEKRKLEQESRLERKIQKEREAEGDMFKDKEVFVTSSYRAKLEAIKKAEEEAKREEYLEGIGDVRKQNDLSGFYRHMYEQKMGGPEKPKEDEKDKEDKESDTKPDKIDIKSSATSKRRAYRKHDEHESEEEEEQSPNDNKKQNNEKSTENKKVHLQSNLDADSDFSIDSDDSESEDEKSKSDKNPKSSTSENMTTDMKDNIDDVPEKLNEENGANANPSEKNGNDLDKDDGDGEKMSKSDGEKMPPPAPKPKIDVWKKRTVEDVYLAAVQRYFQRKQSASA